MTRVSGAVYCHYDSEEDAISAYNAAEHVRVVPDVNHVLDVCYSVLL